MTFRTQSRPTAGMLRQRYPDRRANAIVLLWRRHASTPPKAADVGEIFAPEGFLGPTGSISMSETGERDTEEAVIQRSQMITIALIEDNRLVREGLTALLDRFPDLKVIAAETSCHEALLEHASPRVILLDLALEKGESLQVATKVKQDFPDAGLIVMDLLPSEEDLVAFVGAGVSGFVMKDATLDDLVGTIRSVATGAEVLPPQLVSTLFSEIVEEALSNGGLEVLDSVRMTTREREVIDLIAEGLSNKAIGGRLHISTHTVKSHLRNIMEKLNLHSRLQIAVHYAHDKAEIE